MAALVFERQKDELAQDQETMFTRAGGPELHDRDVTGRQRFRDLYELFFRQKFGTILSKH